MNPALLLPLFTAILLTVIYTRSFIRITGLSLCVGGIFKFAIGGVGLTLLLTLVFGWVDGIAPNPLIGVYAAPLLEELLKLFLLIVLFRHRLVASENLQLYRQKLLAGIILGISFGTLETYLMLITRLSSMDNAAIFGSIPLHLVTTGFLASILARWKPTRTRLLLCGLVIIFHLAYNQLLLLPLPLSYLSFILLLTGCALLLTSLQRPRDFTKDA